MSRRRQVESTEEKAFNRLHIRLAQRRLQGTAMHTPLVLCPAQASSGFFSSSLKASNLFRTYAERKSATLEI
jgi:hypothetical protein